MPTELKTVKEIILSEVRHCGDIYPLEQNNRKGAQGGKLKGPSGEEDKQKAKDSSVSKEFTCQLPYRNEQTLWKGHLKSFKGT